MAQKRKRKNKWISWLILLVLIIVAGVIVFLVWDNYFNNEKNNRNEQGVEQKKDKESDENEKDRGTGSSENIEKEKVQQYDGEDPNKAETLSGAVTYAGVSGDNLMIRVNIDQYLESGECRLTLVRSGATIYNSIANVVGNVSTATCEGFDVPVSKLGGGVVDIIININSGERSGTVHGEVKI